MATFVGNSFRNKFAESPLVRTRPSMSTTSTESLDAVVNVDHCVLFGSVGGIEVKVVT